MSAGRSFNIIDTLDCDRVVDTFPTHRRALNATRRLEPEPSAPPKHPKFCRKPEWRYLIQVAK